MIPQLSAYASFLVFARHRTPGHLRRDDKYQSLNSSVLTPRPSHLPHRLIAHGEANKFTATKAAWPSGRLIGRKTLPGRQNGFTMIELIMVIVILGLLSAFALPRFFDAAADARAARVNAGLGAARSALAIVNASGIGMGEVEQELTLEGVQIAVKFGYPAQPYSLLIAAGMDADFDGAGADGIVHKNSYDLGTGRCGFRYVPPTTAGEAPRFEPWPGSSLPITAADCRRN